MTVVRMVVRLMCSLCTPFDHFISFRVSSFIFLVTVLRRWVSIGDTYRPHTYTS